MSKRLMDNLLTIRRAEPVEAGELAGLAYMSWEQGILPLFKEQKGMRDSERQRFVNYTGECNRRIIVAELDGEMAGWCSRARGRPYVPFLFVAPYLQGRGIGTALLQRMESLLELEGHERIYLETPADHVLAVRFYEQQGYRILALKQDGYSPYEPLVSVRMEKPLNPYRGAVGDEE